MAEGNAFADTFGNMFGGIATVSFAVIIGGVVFGLISFFIYRQVVYKRKFDIKVKIISERASDPNIYFDKGGIISRKGNKYFKLWRTKVELKVPPFKVMETTNQGDYLELWRKSEDEFVFLTKPKIEKHKVIKADGRLYPVGRTYQRSFEGDIYWAMKKKEETKKLLDHESIAMKLLTWAPQIASSVFIMIILFIFLDKLPQLIGTLVELTKELRSLKGGLLS